MNNTITIISSIISVFAAIVITVYSRRILRDINLIEERINASEESPSPRPDAKETEESTDNVPGMPETFDYRRPLAPVAIERLCMRCGKLRHDTEKQG